MKCALPRDCSAIEAFAALSQTPLENLLASACAERDQGFGDLQTWSPKVFIPLTQLCRDLCHYCTFSRPLDRGQKPYLTPQEVLDIARSGRDAGCTEALFTLGEKPELRHEVARRQLQALGYQDTISYLRDMCSVVLKETGLLPHANAGTLSELEMGKLRRVSASQGLMLETTATRLGEKGGPHYQSPDKAPQARLATLKLAGELKVPFTSGILIGIGETRLERIEALIALRDLNQAYGHIQEIIVQNFRAKPRTPMAARPEPDVEDLLWTIAAARLIFGPSMNIQAPPNLTSSDFGRLLDAGINDWGGVSPVTPDHVNPEARWPDRDALEAATRARGRVLVARLPVYPAYVLARDTWLDSSVARVVERHSDAAGFARDEAWQVGVQSPPPSRHGPPNAFRDPHLSGIIARCQGGERIDETAIVRLFEARGGDVEKVAQAADDLRREACGDEVTYVVNRNINYTNICTYRCGFCAFSKGDLHEDLRGKPYDLDLSEVVRRTKEAETRGATEVCLQGGIHPQYTGQTYLDLTKAVRAATPAMHIHAFSPLEVAQGAATLGLAVSRFLEKLMAAGLNTLPGTAAEILDDAVRAVLCPDKLDTAEWLSVVGSAHDVGFRTTATIMFGHVDRPIHWARHLLHVRDLQARTGGFTEFVPLPFVSMEAPIALKGLTRRGPTFREARLMHAVARLVLNPLIPNIQASWVKLGHSGARIVLDGGVNDLGGTLMNESISRAAGASHGQESPPEVMEALIRSSGRSPRQRTTLYGLVDPDLQAKGRNAAPMHLLVLTPPKPRRRAAKEELNV